MFYHHFWFYFGSSSQFLTITFGSPFKIVQKRVKGLLFAIFLWSLSLFSGHIRFLPIYFSLSQSLLGTLISSVTFGLIRLFSVSYGHLRSLSASSGLSDLFRGFFFFFFCLPQSSLSVTFDLFRSLSVFFHRSFGFARFLNNQFRLFLVYFSHFLPFPVPFDNFPSLLITFSHDLIFNQIYNKSLFI